MPAAAASRPRAGGLLRLRLDLAYDGTDFSGWAEQPGRRTVAGVLLVALATALRVEPGTISVVVAGRTDAGVHATGQVAHLDVPDNAWAALVAMTDERGVLDPTEALRRRLAGLLPGDVRVGAVTIAAAGFDARFSALRRRYRYRICDDAVGVPPLRRREVLWHRRRLDVDAMNVAAAGLVGLHDFAAFCRRREGATTVRTLLAFAWDRDPDGFVRGEVVADAFCHSMVRALVGAMLPVGEGRRPPDWAARVLGGGVRDPAVVVVPPQGLDLVQVVYPPAGELAARAAQARAVRTPPVR